MSRIVLGALVLTCLWWPSAIAQQAPPQDPGLREVTRTFAITNARVIQAPGREIERATVIIRDGVITAVAPDARIPFDADVIDGDTLVVYAGFIDALGSSAVNVPALDTSERVADPADPPRDRAGVLPDRFARQHLDPTGADIELLRNAGFAVAHVAPGSGMLSGQSAIILLAGSRPEEMVLRPTHALIARFAGGAGVYPTTPMAVAAMLVELYRQAAQARTEGAAYAADPAARRRPAYDPVSDALQASLAREQPVYFVVDSPQEAYRALRLARELELDLVLAGLPESSMLVNRLEQQRVPVLAPINLPDAIERDTTLLPTDPEHDLARHLSGEVFITEHRTRSYLDVDDERRVLHERRLIAGGLAERNALTLHDAGIQFAFATLGEVGGVRDNLRRQVEAGLPREAALAALTTVPARMLGLERNVGTVEPGRLANLIVTDGDYFDEGTIVRHMFVDGRRFDIDDTPEEADPDAEMTVAGTWDFTLYLPDAAFSGRITFSGPSDDLRGTMDLGEAGTFQLERVALTGNRLTFAIPGTPIGTVEVSGTIIGESYDAEVRAPDQPALRMSATRRPS